eukprot:scaffold58049_cov65-Phaeocystis_antarctica.AAC.1
MRKHRHGRVELVDDLGLDSFYLSLVQPIVVGVGGRHLVQWYHLLSRGLMDKVRRKRRRPGRAPTERSRSIPTEVD